MIFLSVNNHRSSIMPYLRRSQASILNLIKQERQLTLKLEIMKKLVLAVSLVIAFTASAQKRDNGMRNVKVETHQYQKDFAGIRLNPAQQKKIDMLSRERLSEREYDTRIRKILNKQQYESYMAYQHKDWKKDRDFAMNGPRR